MFRVFRFLSKIYLFISALRKLNLRLIKKHADLLKGANKPQKSALVVLLPNIDLHHHHSHREVLDTLLVVKNLLLGFWYVPIHTRPYTISLQFEHGESNLGETRFLHRVTFSISLLLIKKHPDVQVHWFYLSRTSPYFSPLSANKNPGHLSVVCRFVFLCS